jgi:hypothetical protein
MLPVSELGDEKWVHPVPGSLDWCARRAAMEQIEDTNRMDCSLRWFDQTHDLIFE